MERKSDDGLVSLVGRKVRWRRSGSDSSSSTDSTSEWPTEKLRELCAFTLLCCAVQWCGKCVGNRAARMQGR